MVPREPTPEMVEMGCNCRISPNGTTAGGVIATWNAMLAAAPQPPSAPVGVELAALRVQEWLHAEHDLLVPVQEIEAAMRTPCSCPATEHALAQQPAAVDGAVLP